MPSWRLLGFCKSDEGDRTVFRTRGFELRDHRRIALHAYGLTRATRHLDFVTESSAQQPLIAFLHSLSYETLHISSGYSNHLHRDLTMGRLDFVYVSGETNELLFESTQKMIVMEGISIPVLERNTLPL